VGLSEEVAVRISGSNGEDLAPNSTLRQLQFDPVALGALSTQTLSLRNATSLDLHYRWDLRPLEARVAVGAIAPPPPSSQPLLLMGHHKDTNQQAMGVSDASVASTTTSSSSSSSSSSSGGKSGGALSLDGSITLGEGALDGFSISPRRGVLRAKSDTLFDVLCSPSVAVPIGVQAVLVFEQVPAFAVPSIKQPQLLEHLSAHGHGQRLRCRAWFESVCAAVTAARAGSGDAAAAADAPGVLVVSETPTNNSGSSKPTPLSSQSAAVSALGAPELRAALATLELGPSLHRPVRDLLERLEANAQSPYPNGGAAGATTSGSGGGSRGGGGAASPKSRRGTPGKSARPGSRSGAGAGGAGGGTNGYGKEWGLDGLVDVDEFMHGACSDALADAIENQMPRIPYVSIQQVF